MPPTNKGRTSLSHQRAQWNILAEDPSIFLEGQLPSDPAQTIFCPPNFLDLIQTIIDTPQKTPSKPLLIFSFSQEAAQKNYLILKKNFNNNIVEALNAQRNSPLAYGSEFKRPSIIKPLLSGHPNWKCFKKLLNDGSNWPLEELDDSIKLDNVKEALTFGNHKGVTSQPDLLMKLVNDDIIHGFGLPFPL